MTRQICRSNRENNGGIAISSDSYGKMYWNRMECGRVVQSGNLTTDILDKLIRGSLSEEERIGFEAVKEIFEEVSMN